MSNTLNFSKQSMSAPTIRISYAILDIKSFTFYLAEFKKIMSIVLTQLINLKEEKTLKLS